MRAPILLLLVLCAAAAAEESLLARLEAETTKLAEAARGAGVVVTYDTPRPAAPAGLATPARRFQSLGVVNRQLYLSNVPPAQAQGILAGSPARVVAPWATAAEVTVRFSDGSTVRARHVGGDEELGVSVYALPEEREGLALPADWSGIAAGTLAVASSGDLGLVLVQGVHRPLGWVFGPGAAAGAWLVGSGGRLLGFRPAAPAAVPVQPDGYPLDAEWQRLQEARLALGVLTYSSPPRQQQAGNLYLAGPVIRRLLDDIAAAGRLRRGYLGVILGEVAPRPAHVEFKGPVTRMGTPPGVPVTAVLDGSPAQQAGLKAGMRIRRFDGVPCDDGVTFSRLLALRAPGEEVTLALDDSDEIKVTLGDRDAAQAALVSEETLGMTCVDVGPELRAFLGLAEDVRGVVVREVQPGTPAAAACIERGDVLWWGGDGAIADLDELRAAIAGAKDVIVLRGYRGGQTQEFTVRLPEPRTATR